MRELVEHEAAEASEREENWIQERDALREEIRILREGIVGGTGISSMNEAFRTEIDSLTAENETLRQQARGRDRELADQHERVEDLESRIQNLDKERTVLISNVSEQINLDAMWKSFILAI